MAAKPEEITTVPAEGADPFSEAGLQRQLEPNLVGETSGKKEDREALGNATAGIADLSVQDKKGEKLEATEEASPVKAAASEATPSDIKPKTTTADEVTPTTGPFWPETAPDHPLTQFYDAFEGLVSEASHNEVYGIELTKSNPFHTKLILQKFLRANQNDLPKAKQQLLDTLKWRKEFDPVKVASETFEKAKYDGLGYVLEIEGVPESPNKKDIATFNIYGAVKDNKATFGDLDEYVSLLVPNTLPPPQAEKMVLTSMCYTTVSYAGASA
jgi:hypothetical protein